MNTSALLKVMHREAKTMSDKVAVLFVRLLRYVSHLNLMDAHVKRRCASRFGFDIVSGYRHKDIPPDSKMTLEELKKKGYVMDEAQWLSVSSV